MTVLPFETPAEAMPVHCITPFTAAIRRDIARHVAEVRRLFDWPGMPYHDAQAADEDRFCRWQLHNAPLLRQYHYHPRFVSLVSQLAGEPLKPSYVFLSMYGRDGVCPSHTDRPQCHVTVDYLVHQDGERPWPLYVQGKAHTLMPGQGLIYSGTRQRHWRKPMRDDSDATAVDLVFFHFVPVAFQGALD